ncbi:unnamed protein product [Caenorhabditis auriculariae]|uniref:Peptidase M16 N-terminal domain-containing protein n=1 Tax=Caenorhabditis auriculariae TaxID=2777116 RepID=A0A8S1GZF2_9PELO|nr:unnamed protein product [Caenorhabditis auriculariae]
MLSRQAVRGAHHAATAKQLPAPVERVTKLGSGLTVASFEMHGPLSQLVLAFRAGTRYEQSHQNGLVHAIRCFAGRDTNSYPGSSVVWSAADSGANIRSFATRDVFGVAFTVTRDQTARALSILGHAGAQPAFKPWELEDVLPLVRSDIAHRTSYDIVFDDIHRAAFRNSALANPLYAPTERVGKVSTNDLAAFAKKHLVTGSAILYGTNIDHDTLIAYGENHSPIAHGAGGSSSTSDYKVGIFEAARFR